MRTIRILPAILLVVGGLTALAPAAVADATPPFTAVTASADPVYGGGKPVLFAGSQVSLGSLSTTEVSLHATDGTNVLDVDIAPPSDDATLTAKPYTSTADSAGPGVAKLAFVTAGSSACGSSTGSLNITELTASDQGAVTAFAADYTYACNGGMTVSGSLRYASSQPYGFVAPAHEFWSFGNQLVKYNGWRKSFTFTNRGTGTQAFGATSLSNTKSFSVGANSCQGTVAYGATCSVQVIPHPQQAVSQSNTVETGVLTVRPTGLAPITVSLSVAGSFDSTFWAEPGPQRVTLHWGNLPGDGNYDGTVRIYRGTSARALSSWRTVSGGYLQTVDYGRTAGTTYYYAIRPVDFSTNAVGDSSPVIAARPWPKYAAGTYHRLSVERRILSAHRISAGHPYSLKIAGVGGVPSSRVAAVALNVTVAGANRSTRAYAYPAGSARPAAADVAVPAGGTRNDFAITKVGKGGRISIALSSGSATVTVEAYGYFAGAGLSTRYGEGGTLHEFGTPLWIVDTTRGKKGGLPGNYYVDAPINFNSYLSPKVTSVVVEVTAFGSKGSGTISAAPTGIQFAKNSVLTYSPGAVTSTTAIVHSGTWYSDRAYPSVSFLNRGKKAVQLVVTILGYIDDNTVIFGQRYTPTAPRHLLGAKIASGGNRTIHPGSAAGYWTSALNEKLSATNPAKATTVSLRGLGLGAAPLRGQLHAGAHVSAVSATIGVTGDHGNQIVVHNAGGTARIDVWSFGRFDAYPVPTTLNYARATAVPAAGRAPGAVPGAGRIHRLG